MTNLLKLNTLNTKQLHDLLTELRAWREWSVSSDPTSPTPKPYYEITNVETAITLDEIQERGLADDAKEVVSFLANNLTEHGYTQTELDKDKMWKLGFGSPCACGERGLPPGENFCKMCSDEET
jgi:hypothetical protein